MPTRLAQKPAKMCRHMAVRAIRPLAGVESDASVDMSMDSAKGRALRGSSVMFGSFSRHL
ncbi:hypothetical protein BCAR13_1330028 [Paraburkholderia caribensis]|nr:hypothetical protein BCAR13_1330028 [Paraburkholderia caribensis]